jgi:hypothetical protein
MARIRSIKPEYFEDEKLAARCSIPARHLFTGLWVFADDEGRMRASPALLKAQVFPYDEAIGTAEVRALVDELAAGGFVVLYEVNGERYLWVRNFRKHQRVDHPAPSRLPVPPSETPREVLASTPEALASPREEVASPQRALAPDLGSRIVGGGASAALEPLESVPRGAPIPWLVDQYDATLRGGVALERRLWSWMSWRRMLVAPEHEPEPSPKRLKALAAGVAAHGVEQVRKAWLCWLVDPWAAERDPPHALAPFLAADQLAQFVSRASRLEWHAAPDHPDDWKLPESG